MGHSRHLILASFEEQLAKLDATYVHIGVFDFNGVFRHKKIEAAKAVKFAKNGYSFCEVLYQWDIADTAYGGGAFLDRPASIDAASVRAWPFDEKEAICIADFTRPLGELSPRNQLIGQLDKAKKMGFAVHSAFEFEFTLLQETPQTLREKAYNNLDAFAVGNTTYSLKSAVENQDIFRDYADVMGRMGIGFDALHSEMGEGCFETPLAHAEGIKSADDAALFKNFAKPFFGQRSLTSTFMSKLRDGVPGQSGHLHLSLRSLNDSSASFHDPDGPDGLSQDALYFIGGLLKLMPEWLALCSHTVNAYKRLVPGAWAPVYAAWGVQNRTTAVRVINDSAKSTRIEFRVPSADTNPHSALAMCIAAGLWGIENRITPPAKRDDDCYASGGPPEAQFPHDLTAAADRLAASDTARSIFSDAFVDNYAFVCRQEDMSYRKAVSAWERQRYLEFV
jgi:glutamine synthetase